MNEVQEKPKNELVNVIDSSGLEVKTKEIIKQKFAHFFEQVKEWKEKAKDLIVTDESQTREMNMAREARLAMKEIRVAAEKVKKSLKEDSLRYGTAVQDVYNLIKGMVQPIERHLEEQEKFIEIRDTKRRIELAEKRIKELEPYSEFVPYRDDLGRLSEEDFQKIITGAKLQQQAKIDAEKQELLDQERRKREEAERIEKARIENERLKQLAEIERKKNEELEKQAAIERKKNDELKQQAEDDKRKIEELENQKNIKPEPQKVEIPASNGNKTGGESVRLRHLYNEIHNITYPLMITDAGKDVVATAKKALMDTAKFIQSKLDQI